MKILVVAQHIPGAGLVSLLADRGHRVHQVSVGTTRNVADRAPVDSDNPRIWHIKSGELAHFLKANLPRNEVVFAFGDHGHQTWKELLAIRSLLGDARLTVGVHNHLGSRGTNPHALLSRAHSLLFLSKDSYEYYRTFDKEIGRIPVGYIPSLYLPRFRHYKKALRLRSHPKKLSVAMGGRWVTSLHREPGRHHVPRYDFVNAAHLLSRSCDMVTIFGRFQSPPGNPRKALEIGSPPPRPLFDATVERRYSMILRENLNVQHFDFVKDFEDQISRHTFMLNKGILGADEMGDPFENMNYQLRYTASLKAGTPVLVAKGTDKILEDQLKIHKYGLIFDYPEQLSDRNFLIAAAATINGYSGYRKLIRARRLNSAERYCDVLENVLHLAARKAV